MKAIVAVDLNWGIGNNNNLLEKIPEDLLRFKELTYDSVVVMGKNTFMSLYNQQPLKNRINIIISSTLKDKKDDNIIICKSIENFIHYISRFVFVIGGESIYNQLLPYCEEAYVTKINNVYKPDKFFPNLDNNPNWELVIRGENKKFNNINYRFDKYLNKN